MADDLKALTDQLEQQERIVARLAESVGYYTDALETAADNDTLDRMAASLQPLIAALTQSKDRARELGDLLKAAADVRPPSGWDQLKKDASEFGKGFTGSQVTGAKAAIVGATLGGVAGGRVGALVGGTAGLAGGAVVSGVQGIAGLAKAASSGGGAAAMLGPLGAVAGAATQALSAFTGALGQAQQILFGLIVPLARLAAPGVVDRLTMAFEDVQAAVGTTLLPIIEVATDVFNKLNEAFTAVIPTVMPAVEQLADALGGALIDGIKALMPLMQHLGEVAQIVVAAFTPIINQLGESLRKLAPLFDALTPAITITLIPFLAALGAVAIHVMLVAEVFDSLVRTVQTVVAFLAITFEKLREGSIRQALDFAQTGREAAERVATLRQGAGGGEGGRTVAARSASITTVERIGESARSTAFGSASVAVQQRQTQIDLLRSINDRMNPSNRARQGSLESDADRARRDLNQN